MKKLLILFVAAFVVSTLLISCSSNESKSINDLVGHFKSNGYNGTQSDKAFAMIGAEDGCSYYNDEFSIELYKFKEPNSMPSFLELKNGHFGMKIHQGDRAAIEKIFMEFK